MTTLIFLLICYGACNNMIYGSIFEGFRTFLKRFGTGGYSIHKLFTCFMCLPTWMGFVISTIMIVCGMGTLLPFYLLGHPLLTIFFHGLMATGGVWLLYTAQDALERAFIK